MFKIESLVLTSCEGATFEYSFKSGINYIYGANDTGKTEFYNFFDYMLGNNDEAMKHKKWFAHTLESAQLTICLDGKTCVLHRSLSDDVCKVEIDGVGNTQSDLHSYREKLNSFMCNNSVEVFDFWRYAEQEITYRTFTLFSFLGETQQGKLNSFFGKLEEPKYRIKERVVFDYLFNNNIKRILELEKTLASLTEEKKNLEQDYSENQYIANRLKEELTTLGIHIDINSIDIDDLRKIIDSFDLASPDHQEKKGDPLASRVDDALALSDQIKTLEAMIGERQIAAKQNKKRIELLQALEGLISQDAQYAELLEPIKVILDNLSISISLDDIEMQKDVLARKRTKLENLKAKIGAEESVLMPKNLDTRRRAILQCQDYLDRLNTKDYADPIESLTASIRKAKHDISVLRNNLDEEKITQLSKRITELYGFGKIAPFVQQDFEQENFHVEYIREGNIIQPCTVNEDDEAIIFFGSKSRRTLLQLCGYLAFSEYLLTITSCPKMPVLFFDHISQPFDSENLKGVGAILEGFYTATPKEEIQIFLFENRDPQALGINPDSFIQLESSTQSGFNPFYHPEKSA